MRCQRKLIGGAIAATALSLSDGQQPAWRSGLCLVRLESVPSLTRCRPFPGDLAGLGRHQLGTHTLCDARTSCGTTTHHAAQTVGSRTSVHPQPLLSPRRRWHSQRICGTVGSKCLAAPLPYCYLPTRLVGHILWEKVHR